LIEYHASWLLPIAGPPQRDGWVVVDEDRVVAAGGSSRPGPKFEGAREVDLGDAAILPGLVNAHTHLELSYLAGQVPPGSDFVGWIRALLAARRAVDQDAPEVVASVEQAIDAAIRSGTAVVADISNTLVTFGPLARSSLAAVVFFELIGFNPVDPDALVDRAWQTIAALGTTGRVRASLAAHAPYSVAPSLFRAIRHVIDRHRLTCSVHLAESVQEMEFIRRGDGPWRELLEELGAWSARWTAPGVSPVQYLDDCGLLDTRVLAVHGVQMTSADLDRVTARDATLVTCPRSNLHTGAGTPPIEEFYKSGARVAVGTDSLASTPDLNLFGELASLRALAPTVPAGLLLDSASQQGARALGFETEFGTIAPGKRARLLAVNIPPGIADVEEYLVSGIDPEQVRWLES
jgi:cytosine/adenosine deaminase-related metal-dependent hydrolase